MDYCYMTGRHTATGKEYTWSITGNQYNELLRLADQTSYIDKMLIASVVSATPDDYIPRATWVEVRGFGQQISKLKYPQPMLDIPLVIKKDEIEKYIPDYLKEEEEDWEDSYE